MTAIFAFGGVDLSLSALRYPERIIDGLGCGDAVKAALKRAVAWEREERFADAGAFCAALRSATERVAIPAPPDEEEEGAQLARRDLRGKDLSGKNLRYADLTGADLGEANLARADLTGACLCKAQLGFADLTGACLRHVDLSLAHLGGASLLGADLTGANLAGAALRGAKLVGATFDPGALETCDTFGAVGPEVGAIVPVMAAASPLRGLTFRAGKLAVLQADRTARLWEPGTWVEQGLVESPNLSGAMVDAQWAARSANAADGTIASLAEDGSICWPRGDRC